MNVLETYFPKICWNVVWPEYSLECFARTQVSGKSHRWTLPLSKCLIQAKDEVKSCHHYNAKDRQEIQQQPDCCMRRMRGVLHSFQVVMPFCGCLNSQKTCKLCIKGSILCHCQGSHSYQWINTLPERAR